ncbi:MAG: PAS domain-containing protein [Solirubrobacteraceae bacterium]
MEQNATTRFARQLTLLDHGERIAGLGSWAWMPGVEQLLWSDNLFRLFGFEPGEAVPSPELVTARAHPDDRSRVEESLRAMVAEEFYYRDLEYRIVRADGAIRLLRATVATVHDQDSGRRRIVGSVQDVTLQRGADRQLAAHVAVTYALDAWTSFETGAADLLVRLAAAMELAFAALWLPDGETLVARAIWHRESPALASAADVTRRWQPGLQSATIGRAFAGRQAVILDVAEAGPGKRDAAMRRAGLRGTMVVPAVASDETFAVLEFLSSEPIEGTQRLRDVLDGIGREVGRFLSHRRGELTASVLTPRELEVLQRAAQGQSSAAVAADLYLSPATVKRHFERAYASLGVSDRAAAVGEAMRRGLIT